MDSLETGQKYIAQRQICNQWQPFLSAFSMEFSQQIPIAELRVLMIRLGKLMAEKLPMPAGNTLASLEESINAIWLDMDWGWVQLSEKNEGLFIDHHVSPLCVAFGAEALSWSSAILEGVYQYWFAAIGAGTQLQLTQVSADGVDHQLLVFCFGRPA